jgi:Flp pilus assembly CpaF family ATPase
MSPDAARTLASAAVDRRNILVAGGTSSGKTTLASALLAEIAAFPSALYRLEQLVEEAVVTGPRRLITEAIDLVVFISGRGSARRVDTILSVAGIDAPGDYATALLAFDPSQSSEETN